jgi:hypothetical protein
LASGEEVDPDDIAVVHNPRIESDVPWLSKNGVRRDIAAADAPFAGAWLAIIGDRQAEAARLTRLFVDGAPATAVRVRLDALGPELWPRALLARYRQARLRDDRKDCVRAATGLARDSMAARELGVTALADRSWSVRYWAHQLLAYSLDSSIVPLLRVARGKETRPELLDSIDGAIKSIEKRNHNLFLDRRETGRAGWSANPCSAVQPPPPVCRRAHSAFPRQGNTAGTLAW